MNRRYAWPLPFIGTEDGNITIFSTLMTVLMLMLAGASVDFMRHEASRVRLQTTLDRAVLAAADLDQEQQPADVVADYVAKAGLADYLTGVRIDQNFQERVVTATAGADLDTMFLHISGHDSLMAQTLSAAEERIANVEISLVLDISGSMRWNDRMTNMKPAAKGFVEKVMTDNSGGVTTLNLIPFAGSVNPGDTMFEYLRGERPRIKGNNGWGNGDQDAPGGSLCNNNAENADEGAIDPACGGDGTAPEGYFTAWTQAISNVVFYFDTDGDDIFDVAHKVEAFPEGAPRDADDFFAAFVAFLIAQDPELTDPGQFLGASVKGGTQKAAYFQVKGDENGPSYDLGPTKNRGRIPGDTFSYASIDQTHWALFYTDPNEALVQDAEVEAETIRVNMPSSCVEIPDSDFAATAMPGSRDYVPHFQHWAIDPEVMDWGWCPEDDTAIQYYSSDADHLTQFIDGIRMHDGTGAQYGMKYALSLLDPNTRDDVAYLIGQGLVDPAYLGRPIDWHDPETEKFIVVMTDGMVTDQVRPNDPRAPINGVEELLEQSSPDYHVQSTSAHNVQNLYAQCTLARSLGVTVFTIAFETGDTAAEQMRLCASSDSHFFRVEGAEIIDAFDTIARQINNLRLIQ